MKRCHLDLIVDASVLLVLIFETEVGLSLRYCIGLGNPVGRVFSFVFLQLGLLCHTGLHPVGLVFLGVVFRLYLHYYIDPDHPVGLVFLCVVL